ncbi:MAG: hypothetical protein HY868_27415 [Chloroflexi bacterium]|nr:hypothetical protein [Chloroflexota bacterium]
MSPAYTTPAFHDFLEKERKRIANAYREVEEIQIDYQGAYTRFKTDHDKTLNALVAQLDLATLDASLREPVDARVPIEQQWIAERIAELDKQITQGVQLADGLIAKARKEQADLRALNPKSNEQEEKLKTDRARWKSTLDQLNAQVSTLGHGLGFIFNAWKIHAIDRERFRAVGRLEEIEKQLAKVRKDWQDLGAMVDKNTSGWREEWQKATTRVATLRQERDFLAQNTGTLARQRAITFVFDNLKTPTENAALKPMVALNHATDDYQTALGAIAGILGVVKSVDDGLGRFSKSVKTLMDEQNRHDQFLAPLNINVPDTINEFGKTWDELALVARDEKVYHEHPKDFVKQVQPFLDARLTAPQIKSYFDALDGALKSAMSKWSHR